MTKASMYFVKEIMRKGMCTHNLRTPMSTGRNIKINPSLALLISPLTAIESMHLRKRITRAGIGVHNTRPSRLWRTDEASSIQSSLSLIISPPTAKASINFHHENLSQRRAYDTKTSSNCRTTKLHMFRWL